MYGEEFSTTNIAIIQQLAMLQNLLNLPLLAFGDYNIDILDMKQSGLLKAHGMHVLELPGGPSVKFGHRKIDYIIYSGGLHQLIRNMHRIYKVPYGPHFGYKVTFKGNSCITGLRISMPKELPLLQFQEEYDKTDRELREQKLNEAKQMANTLLQTQKEKTGYAILGQPPVEILIDKKTPEATKSASKAVGEHLARNALTTEIFVLNIAKIPKEQYRHYIGRSQFPKMMQEAKPPKGVPDFVSKEDLVCKTGILQNTIHKIVHIKAEPKDYKALGKFRRYIYNNVLQINKDCMFAGKQFADYLEQQEWVTLHTMLEAYRPKLILLYEEINKILSKLIKTLMIHVGYESSRQWKTYVNECFDKGGGRMFHNVAIEDKAYLSVTNEHLGTYRHSPRQHLEYQANTWSPRWHRASDAINKGIKNMLHTIVDMAKRDTEIDNTYNIEKYDQGLKGYPDKSRGIDTWAPSELRALPTEGKTLMADAMEKHLKRWHSQYRTSSISMPCWENPQEAQEQYARHPCCTE